MTQRQPPPFAPGTALPPPPISYELAKQLARSTDPGQREALAYRTDAPPEILYFLAEDPVAAVRRAVSANPTTPPLAYLVLSEDDDEVVRATLAKRMAVAAPGLGSWEHDRARQAAYRVLETLARDQIPRVRQIISEALKDLVDAPAELINRLARDVEEVVSSPILQFSPVLSDEDLLDIIAERPNSAALSAISRRSSVAVDVCDAIAASDDVDAIVVLLANPSAQIREETLDSLIDRAENRPSWHEPLVHRPSLPPAAATKLAQFVADRLIEVLINREDLSPETVTEVKRVVHRRLEANELGSHARPSHRPSAPSGPFDGESWGEARSDAKAPAAMIMPKAAPATAWGRAVPAGTGPGMDNAATRDRVRVMIERGLLNEGVLTQAIRAGDLDFTVEALAMLGALAPKVVEATIKSASSRGITSVVWKSGMPPRMSLLIQARLARIAPRDLMANPTDDHDGFGLSEAEMEWQLEMFTKAAEQGTL